MNSAEPIVIVHVIHHLVIGGMENGLVNLVNRLDQDRYRHIIICVEDFSEFRDRITADVRVIPMFRSRSGVWPLRRRLYRLFREIRPDIVHTRNMSALDAIIPARLAGVKYCIHGEHGFDVDDLSWSNRKKQLLRKLHRPFVHDYIAVSQHLRNNLLTVIGCRKNRVHQIYNGVDTEKFASGNSKATTVLPLTFGTVGRLQKVKDQRALVLAFARLVEASSDVRKQARLLIYGDGPMKDSLEKLIEDNGLEDCAHMMGATHNPAAAYREIDVFVLPSLMEGISNTILEAMSSGLPVLASNVGGNAELVTDRHTGFLFEAGDSVGLSRLMNTYFSDRTLLTGHGIAGREKVESEFSLTRMIHEYEGVYSRCVRP